FFDGHPVEIERTDPIDDLRIAHFHRLKVDAGDSDLSSNLHDTWKLRDVLAHGGKGELENLGIACLRSHRNDFPGVRQKSLEIAALANGLVRRLRGAIDR